jgi:hypothetical protein
VAVPVSPETADLIRLARGGIPVVAEGGPDVRETGNLEVAESVERNEGDSAPDTAGVADRPVADLPGAPAIAEAAEADIVAMSAEERAASADAGPESAGPAADDGNGPAAESAVPDETVTSALRIDGASPPVGAAQGTTWPGPGGGVRHTDLVELPGIGAGLVWLLGRCGINSLADLAAADASRLERDLGLVGQLLDLPSWIALAGQAIATGNDETDAEGKSER